MMNRLLLIFFLSLLAAVPAPAASFAPASMVAAIKQEIPELRPLKSDLPPPPEVYNRRWWFVITLVAIVCVTVLCWPRKPVAKPVETPAAIARRSLKEAASSDQLVVAGILRRYLISALGLPGSGASTEEISEALFTQVESDPGLANQVSELLAACDAAKFAPGTPPLPEASSAAEAAVMLVDKIDRRRGRPVVERTL